MSKRSKKRAKQRRKQYNKKEFMSIFCSNCGLCNNSLFCYNKIYKKDPKTFLEHCFKQLTKISWWPSNTDYNSVGTTTEILKFQQIFCSANVCKNVCKITLKQETCCPHIFKCIAEFRSTDNNTLINKKKKRKKNKKYICEPYVTFFNNDRKEWIKKIEKIFKKIEKEELK